MALERLATRIVDVFGRRMIPERQPPSIVGLRRDQRRRRRARSREQNSSKIRGLGRNGWGTWIRTRTSGVRVRGSTVKLSPSRGSEADRSAVRLPSSRRSTRPGSGALRVANSVVGGKPVDVDLIDAIRPSIGARLKAPSFSCVTTASGTAPQLDASGLPPKARSRSPRAQDTKTPSGANRTASCQAAFVSGRRRPRPADGSPSR